MTRIALVFEDTAEGLRITAHREVVPGPVLTPAEKTVEAIQAILTAIGTLVEVPNAPGV